MIMCTGFNRIPCMQKMAISSVLVTPAQKRPCYELSPDTVQDVFYVLSLGHLSWLVQNRIRIPIIVQGMDGD